MLNTFDRSPALELALVATEDLREPHYVPLQEAPATERYAAAPYLRQMHTVANGVVHGLVVHALRPLRAQDWQRLS